MDLQRFSASSPGKLVTIPEGKAFVPDALPGSFRFNPELWPLLAEAKSQISLLEGIGRGLPNPGLLLNPLANREALQSSRLEGTYITAREYLLFELEPEEDKRTKDTEAQEVSNYRRALYYGQNPSLPLSLRLIRELHQILMDGVRGGDKTPGQFRTGQVAIGENMRFIPPPPVLVPDCLREFEGYLNSKPLYDALLHCFVCHYQFETIHPFSDGNGRVGRLLLAIMLHRLTTLTKPWLYLSDVLERQKDAYCNALFNVSAQGNWDQWIELCLNATIAQTNETLRRCERLTKLKEEFHSRVNDHGGTVRLNQIVDVLFRSPFVRVTQLQSILKVSYPTAKADCERLSQCAILKPLPTLTPATYYSPEVFEAAYENIGE